METKFKNRIIAISGEPVSGKGTIVKLLKQELLKDGYTEEHIHIVSAGKLFRVYFEKIINIIKNKDNDKVVKKLLEDEQMKFFIKKSEYRKVLENTILEIEKDNINLDDISKVSELNNSPIFNEIRNIIDFVIDDGIKQKGIEINKKERKDEIWIFDSRMAFDNIPEAFSVRIITDPKVAGARLFADAERGKEDKYETLEDAEKAREERRLGEIKRYKEKYGADIEDENNYDCIIDTSYVKFEDMSKVADEILKNEKRYLEKIQGEDR